MSVYMVERHLPGITMDQLGAAQKAAISTGQEMTKQGKSIRYIRSTFVPQEGFLYVPLRGIRCGGR